MGRPSQLQMLLGGKVSGSETGARLHPAKVGILQRWRLVGQSVLLLIRADGTSRRVVRGEELSDRGGI